MMNNELLMNKVLVILTTEFPYGKSESFLCSEIKYLEGFKKIIILPLASKDKVHFRKEIFDNHNVEVIDIDSKTSLLQKSFNLLKMLFNKEFWHEVRVLVKKSNKFISSLKELLVFSSECENTAKKVKRCLLATVDEDDEIILYSYWLYEHAYVAVYVKKRLKQVIKAISRCHGFDVYEERHFGYIPFRRYIIEGIDKIYCISDHGRNYLENKYLKYNPRLSLARLGTIDYGISDYKRSDHCIRIVSCAYCVPLKRIDYIIDALSIIDKSEFQVEWTHYGDGLLYEQLLKYASERLVSDNFKYTFKGHMNNQDIMSEYSKCNYDVFINTSSTEGLPVSIMEAMSFGIPVIATDVGGTGELVKNNVNGFIMPADCSFEDVTRRINCIINMNDADYMNMRNSARATWEEQYNAKKNFKFFAKSILNE